MTIPSTANALLAIPRALVTLCALAWANHASTDGLGVPLQTVESLDQSIQETLQGALESTESDYQEASKTSDSQRDWNYAEPRVASEGVEAEEDQEESNVVSSAIIKLKPDIILPERSESLQSTPESGAVLPANSGDPEDISDSMKESASETSKVTDRGSNRGSNEEGQSVVWVGQARITHHNYGGAEGLHTVQVNHTIYLAEVHRFDIIGEDERLVGQLVSLRDKKGGWTSFQDGWTRSACGCARDITEFTGSAYGGSDQKIVGWIYHSMVEDDPLGDILPNGAYSVKWDDISTDSSFTSTRTIIKCSESFTKSQSILEGQQAVAGPTWSLQSSMPIPMLPSHDGQPISVGRLREAFQYYKSDYHDQQTRQLIDGKMRGVYTQKIPIATSCDSKLREETQEWFVQPAIEVEPKLAETPYRWRPKRGDENNTLEFTVTVSDLPGVEGKFRFTLFDVTREKGWAVNAGDREDDALDLRFVEDDENFLAPKESDDGWVLEANRTLEEATIRIEADDYGAWGRLRCEVNTGGWWFPCVSMAGKRYITIPYDEDQNKIADFWEEQKGISGDATADADKTPEGRESGDGFSNYEEYRGFQIQGLWRDTEPTEKDLFVHNASNREEITSSVREFETKSSLTVHEINEDELDRASRIVNFNRGINQAVSRDQKGQAGVIVVVQELDDICGKAASDPSIEESLSWSPIGGPNVTQLVLVDPSCLYGTTTVHELGHAVNLWHPGGRYLVGDCEDSLPAGMDTPYSGPLNNYMRYRNAEKYIGPDNKCYKYPKHLEERRSAFVTDPTGTGMNAGPERWEYNTLDGKNYPYPVSGDATCSGTLIDKSLSLNQDAKTYPTGC